MGTGHFRRGTEPLVTIFQPYVPAYRVPLFDALSDLLAADGLSLAVAHTQPVGTQGERGDSRVGKWSTDVRQLRGNLAGHTITARSCAGLVRRSRVVVAELASTNLDTYWMAARHARKLVLWGHAGTYVTAPNAIDQRLELWLASRAAHTMVYTASGAAYLRGRGIAANNCTVLRNATDTTALRRAMAELSPDQVARFRTGTGASGENTVAFVGALDESKQLPLLLDASALVRRALPDFTLLVAGDGPMRDELARRAARQPEIRVLPYADHAALARIGAVAKALVVPGRVGLIAVDAMTLGLPVITTEYPYHAPEREYLRPAFCWVSARSPRSLADTLVERLGDRSGLAAASAAAAAESVHYSIEGMARRMHSAIVEVGRRAA